jgi:hypothetical protein
LASILQFATVPQHRRYGVHTIRKMRLPIPRDPPELASILHSQPPSAVAFASQRPPRCVSRFPAIPTTRATAYTYSHPNLIPTISQDASPSISAPPELASILQFAPASHRVPTTPRCVSLFPTVRATHTAACTYTRPNFVSTFSPDAPPVLPKLSLHPPKILLK